MSKDFQRTFEVQRKAIRTRAIWLREISLAYFCICLIESACLFPAVWVR